MLPSRWASVVTQVHAMTGADEETILARMPYARVLQYLNLWRLNQGIVSVKPKKAKGLKTIL